jgi:hypothetical protein
MPTIEGLESEIASLRGRVESTESLLALQALKARYGDLVDQRFSRGERVDPDSLRRLAEAAAQLFTEDAVWDGGPGLGRHVGRAAIAARLARPTLAFSRHLFVKPRIGVDGDRAWGRWDLLCPCRREDGSSWWLCGYEDDEYLLVDGVWLHQKLELTTVFLSRVDQGWEKILA